MRAILLATLIGISMLGVCGAASAADVQCEVLTIEASMNNQGTDPALQAVAAVLQKAPFNEFNTFRLVNRSRYDLALSVPVTLRLPSNLRGTLEHTGEKEGRLNLTLRLSREGGIPAVIAGKATPGTPFIAAGLKSDNGRWIFAVICNRASGVVQH